MTRPVAADPTGPQYAERLWVPLRWWVQGTMLVASAWLAVAVATPPEVAAAVALGVLALVVSALVTYGSARVSVGGGELRAGQAHIDTHLLGGAEPLDAEATRRVAGREADARAYLLLRPYLRRSVRVWVADPDDPTPYWLISSRHPERLVAALRSSMSDRAAG